MGELVGGRALKGVYRSGWAGVGEERGKIVGKMVLVLAEGESEGLGESDVSMDVNVCEGSKVGVDPEQEWVIRVI
jgi:hypothetical protein